MKEQENSNQLDIDLDDIFVEGDQTSVHVNKQDNSATLEENTGISIREVKKETTLKHDSDDGWAEPIEVVHISRETDHSMSGVVHTESNQEFPEDSNEFKGNYSSGKIVMDHVDVDILNSQSKMIEDCNSSQFSFEDGSKKKSRKKRIWLKVLFGLCIFLIIVIIGIIVAIGYFTRNLTMDDTSLTDNDLGIGSVVEWNEQTDDFQDNSNQDRSNQESERESSVDSSKEENSSDLIISNHYKHQASTLLKDRNQSSDEEILLEESSSEESEEESSENDQGQDLDNVSYTPVQTVSREGVINIALFGLSAEYAFDTLRSDSMIILTIDTNHWMIKLTSILRDSKVPIEGYRAQKINAAYRYGGPWLAVKTINQNFGLDVRNYITVDLGQMEAIINAIGGVYLYVTPGEAAIIGSGSGDVWLNGWQAVSYCRIRSIGSDTERANRQRKVLNYIFYRFKDMGVSEKLSAAQQLLSYVATSLSWGEIVNLFSLPLGSYGISTNSVPIQGVDYGVWGGIDSYGEWVWVFDIPSAARRIQNYIYG